MTMKNREPPNHREAPRCAVCIHSDHAWYCFCKKYDTLTAWNNICDDYEAEAGEGGEG